LETFEEIIIITNIITNIISTPSANENILRG
jgi:hypothetical protein